MASLRFRMKHVDMAHRGSVFAVQQPSVKRPAVFWLCLLVLLTAAFTLALHVVDYKSLAKLGLFLAVGILWKLWSKTCYESVLILPYLGLQVETHNCLGQVCTHFLSLSQIKDIVITEAVTMNSIRTYLVVLLNGADCSGQQMLYPLFIQSRPRVDELLQVYQVCHEKLLHPHTTPVNMFLA
ncbi:unnamed protein product [Candidula unifasciata]|uniref:Phosphatidylinositol N-acetylglucosaminyltransferase subunit H conserved domain-containing protein n=1 Tax=Candidula unifasciata TaxID=100452 RepID=A0A8S3YR07_9EUPU|nr:unnamed protein product [Candidula unifasciata]